MLPMTHGTHDSGAGGRGTLALAAHASLHCLMGCMIGEVAGLALGALIGLGAWATMGLATALAVVSGLTLAALPLARSEGLPVVAALRMIWAGEIASILAMEVAINGADYALGGVSASLGEPIFWIALALAAPAGWLAALPVNYVMIRRGIGHHHHGG